MPEGIGHQATVGRMPDIGHGATVAGHPATISFVTKPS
jgi:hypothetical protein